MLYWLCELHKYFFAFNVFRYITFRAAGAALTALILSVLLGPLVIRKLQKIRISEEVRTFPLFEKLHEAKIGTPSMGGIVILIVLMATTILWARPDNIFIRLLLFATAYLGILGFYDDYLKWKRKKGMRAWQKFSFQAVLGLIVGLYLCYYPPAELFSSLSLPFFKNVYLEMGFLYLPFLLLVIIGSSNAVNLTDGLDGLAIGSLVIVAATMIPFAYLSGHMNFSQYLFIPFIRESGEISVYLSALVGAGLGFLWFNAYPAQVFMGDTGSLALGGAMGMVALFTKKELVFFIAGGIFVLETLSVILQVLSFKLRGVRIFKMSPLHHHFEMKGWKEPKIVVRFWIINIILALIAFSTLKIR